MLAEAAGPDQRAARKMRSGHCTKKIHPGSPEVTFLETDTSFAQSHHTLLKFLLILFLPHTNTVILLEPYCGTITRTALWYYHRAWVTFLWILSPEKRDLR